MDTLAVTLFRSLLPLVVPEGTRLMLVADNLLETMGTRTDSGAKLSFAWGDPADEGWYVPVVHTAVPDWHDQIAMLRRQLVGSPPNVDSIDAAIGYALNECEEKIMAALGEIDPEYEGT